ncbi:MAG TPA: hypothetical protein VFB22_08450 [Candidatus Baltobacteraceae bacterium]|nr:hypothetical protein [Candidatus Baltobacteraceae bacterium]
MNGHRPEDEDPPLDRLERASREVETLAAEAALGLRTMGGCIGARNRLEVVKQRLKIALDELASLPENPDDITDE